MFNREEIKNEMVKALKGGKTYTEFSVSSQKMLREMFNEVKEECVQEGILEYKSNGKKGKPPLVFKVKE